MPAVRPGARGAARHPPVTRIPLLGTGKTDYVQLKKMASAKTRAVRCGGHAH